MPVVRGFQEQSEIKMSVMWLYDAKLVPSMNQTSQSLISSFCSSEVILRAPSLPSSTGKMVGSRAGREDLVAMSYITIQIQYLKYCDKLQFFNEGGISQKFDLYFHDLVVLLLSHDIEASNFKICKDSLEIL